VNGQAMSALIPLRLIYLRCGERRFVPKPDSCAATNGCTGCSDLLDHLVGAGEHRNVEVASHYRVSTGAVE
jgi:hypothetical protein